MKNFETYKKDIERELMVKIIMGLRHGSLSQKKAQTIAQEYLVLMSAKNTDELFECMGKLIEKYAEMLEVYIKTASEYFNQKKEYVLSEARKYMQTAQYEHAVTVLQKGGLN